MKTVALVVMLVMIVTVAYAYPEPQDFNDRFQRMSDLFSYLTFKTMPPLNVMQEGDVYIQYEVNYNFDVLLDELEDFLENHYNRGWIYRK